MLKAEVTTTQEQASQSAKADSVQHRCEECKKSLSLYQCPRCNHRTCSLECCLAHKKRTGCNGKRERSSFLPLSRMSDNVMRSDYFFLEEVLDEIPRNRKRAKTMEPKQQSNNAQKKSRRFAQQAERRGITLQIMPPMMDRHKSNTSWYCGPRDMITWKVEVVICRPEATISFQLSENESNMLDHVLRNCEKQGHILTGGYRLFLRKLPCPAKNPRYFELSPSDSLKTQLQGRTVIEHPTIYCVPEDDICRFPTDSEKITELPTDREEPMQDGE